MNIDPEKLEALGYVEVERLPHKDIIPLVQRGLKLKNRYSRTYLFLNLLLLTILTTSLAYDIREGFYNLGEGLNHVSYGVGIAFLLIPLHEYIHVLAYKHVGAKATSYDANLKKFYFMALADRFVANFHEFRVVALAPIVCISCMALIPLFFTTSEWTITVLALLLTHTAFCSGDFGLLAYMWAHADEGMVTYDDKTERTSYFLVRRNDIENVA